MSLAAALIHRISPVRALAQVFFLAKFSPTSGGLHSSIQILERLFFWTRNLNFLGGLHWPSMIIFSFMAYVSSLISVSRSIGHDFELDYLLLEILQICSIFWF